MSLYLGENLISGIATPIEGARNIGQIITSTLPLTDAGLHLLDGALIDGSGIYADFVDYISNLDLTANYFCTEAEWQASITDYGVCGKFVYDSSNNTVRLPKITGIIEGTTDVSALGDLIEAGLPNITGTLNVGGPTSSAATNLSGAFYLAQTSVTGEGGGSGSDYLAGFDASLLSTIYGNSTTVQPQTIKAFYYIVVATSTKTDLQVDIDEIATDLNGKADVDLSNCTKPYIVETYQNGNSWYRVYSDGWCEQGGIIGDGVTSISLLKEMSNDDYPVIFSYRKSTSTATVQVKYISTHTQTSSNFTVTSSALNRNWLAYGYIA